MNPCCNFFDFFSFLNLFLYIKNCWLLVYIYVAAFLSFESVKKKSICLSVCLSLFTDMLFHFESLWTFTSHSRRSFIFCLLPSAIHFGTKAFSSFPFNEQLPDSSNKTPSIALAVLIS